MILEKKRVAWHSMSLKTPMVKEFTGSMRPSKTKQLLRLILRQIILKKFGHLKKQVSLIFFQWMMEWSHLIAEIDKLGLPPHIGS